MPSRNWSQLPSDILVIISEKITTIRDYVRCSSVCRNWRSAMPRHPRHLPPQLPWLMTPVPALDNPRPFFDLSSGEAYKLHLPAQLLTSETRFYGSSCGCLVLQDPATFAVSLVNLVTGDHIPLPPVDRSPAWLCFPPFRREGIEYDLRGPYRFDRRLGNIWKAVVSSAPSSSSECVVMAKFEGAGLVAFCRVGDTSWTVMEGGDTSECVADLTYRDGRFCTLTSGGKVTFYDVGPPWRATVYSTGVGAHWDFFDYFMSLVENSSTDLLMVTRPSPYWYPSSTDDFVVLKLDFDGQPQWRKVDSIGDSMIVLGFDKQCFAYSSSNFDGYIGRRNHIYFCVCHERHVHNINGTNVSHSHAIKSYSIEDGKFQQIRSFGWFPSKCPHPIWITPSFH